MLDKLGVFLQQRGIAFRRIDSGCYGDERTALLQPDTYPREFAQLPLESGVDSFLDGLGLWDAGSQRADGG